MNKPIAGWYVVYTRPQHEKRILLTLDRNGIEYFFPMTTTVRQWHDRKKLLTVPLFPSYIFIKLEGAKQLFSVLSCESVVSVLNFGGEYCRVNDTVIDDLNLITKSCGKVTTIENGQLSGKTAIISEGALTGLNCEIVNHKNRSHLLVRVKILNRTVLAEMPAHACAVVA
jgi:transcriptional antiterminator RfaH